MRPALLLLLLLAACGPVAPAAPPVEIQPSQAQAMLRQTTDLDSKRVVLEGYVYFDSDQSKGQVAMGPELRSSPAGGGEHLVKFEMDYGPGPNQLDLHEIKKEKFGGFSGAPEIITFDPTKATWQDAEGKAHLLSEKVRVTGVVRYAGYSTSGAVSEDDPSSPSGKRFYPMLTKAVLSPSAH